MCSINTAAGAPRDTRAAGSMLGACAETMVLQQSWVRFEGVHGIEPQHCMLCGSGAIADMQSANCSSNKAATARVRNILLLITSHNCRSFQACKSTSCRSFTDLGDNRAAGSGAGDGIRTRIRGLGSRYSTTEPRPPYEARVKTNRSILWPQALLFPDCSRTNSWIRVRAVLAG